MDATTTAGKRKSEDDDVDIISDADANLFASLPDTTWEMISSYAAPPDVYNLSLSSKHFFREVSADKPSAKKTPSANAAAKRNVGRRSKRLAAAAAAVAATASAAAQKTMPHHHPMIKRCWPLNFCVHHSFHLSAVSFRILAPGSL